jgi:transposase
MLRSRGSHLGGKGGCELRGDAQLSSRLHRRVFRVSFKFNNVSLWDAVFYLLRSGRAWRMLPREYQPWQTVYYHFRKWRRDGWLRQARDRLRAAVRETEGRDRDPSGAVIDSQAVKSTGVGGPEHGYDGAKRLAGRKRHPLP